MCALCGQGAFLWSSVSFEIFLLFCFFFSPGGIVSLVPVWDMRAWPYAMAGCVLSFIDWPFSLS